MLGMKDRRPLDTTAHRGDRARYLRTHPLCERCLKIGKGTPALILHHKDRNQLNRDESNFEALCNECHEVEHGRKAIAGCDAEGRPLDPGHWWNDQGEVKHGKRKAK